jgi:hypothetical protein
MRIGPTFIVSSIILLMQNSRALEASFDEVNPSPRPEPPSEFCRRVGADALDVMDMADWNGTAVIKELRRQMKTIPVMLSILNENSCWENCKSVPFVKIERQIVMKMSKKLSELQNLTEANAVYNIEFVNLKGLLTFCFTNNNLTFEKIGKQEIRSSVCPDVVLNVSTTLMDKRYAHEKDYEKLRMIMRGVKAKLDMGIGKKETKDCFNGQDVFCKNWKEHTIGLIGLMEDMKSAETLGSLFQVWQTNILHMMKICGMEMELESDLLVE